MVSTRSKKLAQPARRRTTLEVVIPIRRNRVRFQSPSPQQSTPRANTPAQPASPIVPVTDTRPAHVRLISILQPEGRATLFEHTIGKTTDVDKWEIAMSPAEYQARYNHTIALVQLVSHIPSKKPAIAEHTNGEWMLLASSVHQIWVQAQFKLPFIKEIKRYQVVQPGKNPIQPILGRVLVPVYRFTQCLIKAGCNTLWIKAYGQKLPLTKHRVTNEPAQSNHLFAKYNSWDIGKSFDSPFIWLFAPAIPKKSIIQMFPMVIPASNDFGSLNLTFRYQSRDFFVKVYARLVHLIKSFNSQMGHAIPKTLFGLRNQGKQALEMIASLRAADPKEITGFRIEVTVQAPTLSLAVKIVEATPFFNLQFWLDPQSHVPELQHLRLIAKICTEDSLIRNASAMHALATTQGILSGDNRTKPSSRAVQGLTDVLAALGWCSGLRRPTQSSDPKAWWVSQPGQTTQIGVLEKLSNKFKTVAQQLEFIKLFRTKSRFGYIPCQQAPADSTHRYQLCDNKNLRVRCGKKECKHQLKAGELMKWLAQLTTDGHFDMSYIGIQGNNTESSQSEITKSRKVTIGPITVKLVPARFQVPHRDTLVQLATTPRLFRTQFVDGDGNCMFAAFANAFGGAANTHKTMRREAIKWARQNQDFLAPFIPEEFDGSVNRYLQEMAKLKVYGDNLMLEALCRAFEVSVAVLNVAPGTGEMAWTLVGENTGTGRLGLYLGGEHYENLVMMGDVYSL